MTREEAEARVIARCREVSKAKRLARLPWAKEPGHTMSEDTAKELWHAAIDREMQNDR